MPQRRARSAIEVSSVRCFLFFFNLCISMNVMIQVIHKPLHVLGRSRIDTWAKPSLQSKPGVRHVG